ncbi:hypothetical protein D9Q98_006267 [Chlorella vulgaris]|uniref:ABC transporter domain-containing protein n=1 Tax=Chlorella vulgaris TaxID=3077 RepID=A0A9D4TXC2_CHLVU|nr:hypothetical protein D9Q98_006267 [Chlorella vulgaris]
MMSKPVEQDVEGGEVGGEAPLFCPSNSAAPAPALPGKAITVTFQQLTFEVDQGRGAARKRRRAPLLQDVAGFVLPGQLTAVLGPSGSGKTTLLDLLSGRKTTGHLAPGSCILFNGRPATSGMLRHDVGYVEQRDTLLPLLTPVEMLRYTAELKQPRSTPAEVKRQLVAALIEQLSLDECQHTAIGGGLTRGISGGESKRVGVGVAMISRPAVLLCDEPTSGLDSWSAHAAVSAMLDLARLYGIAVCCTIHSPPPDTFALFHRVMLLQRGRLVYFGPNGDPVEAYFAAHFPSLRSRRPTEGISDYIIDVTSCAAKDSGSAAAHAFADAYAASDLRLHNEQRIAELLAAAAAAEPADGGQGHGMQQRMCGWLRQGTVTPWWWGLLVLLRYRTARGYSRASWLLPRMLGPAIPTFFVVTVSVLFMVVVSFAFNCMSILSALVLERAVYLRERSDGLYHLATYLAFKVVEELSVVLAVSFPITALIFWLVRLQGSVAFVWLAFLLTASTATVLALLTGALFSNLDVATMVLTSYTSSLLYFSGFLITWSAMPVYWKWYATISYLRYSWGALMVNQFEGERDVAAFGGQPVLLYFGLQHVDKWAWLGWLALFLLAFLCLTWLALTCVRHQQR